MKKSLLVVSLLLAGVLGGWLAGTTDRAGASSTTSAGYVITEVRRVYDSRNGRTTRLPAGTVVTISTGVAGATAVAVNLTVDQPAAPGFVAAWASGPWPGTSIMNTSIVGQTIANFAIIPVALDGTFQMLTQQPAHLVVDVMGYMAGGGTPVVPAGVNAVITGYGPGYSLTSVLGSISNGSSTERDLRVDVRCPDGTVEYDLLFNLAAGATKGWAVYCSGVFRSGASVSVIDI